MCNSSNCSGTSLYIIEFKKKFAGRAKQQQMWLIVLKKLLWIKGQARLHERPSKWLVSGTKQNTTKQTEQKQTGQTPSFNLPLLSWEELPGTEKVAGGERCYIPPISVSINAWTD